MSRPLLFLFSVLLLGSWTALNAQYIFPTEFSSGDSTALQSDTRSYAAHGALHFGDIPGMVFQRDHARPRISFYYQHDAAYTFPGSRFQNGKEQALTSTGMFSLVGDITPNLQVILRYNSLILANNAAEISGYGVRYRSAVGTDSLHSLAAGVMMQKLAGGAVAPLESLDFILQYGWYRAPWVLHGDLAVNYSSGVVRCAGDEELRYKFDHRNIHLGLGMLRQWEILSGGVKLRTDLTIWNLIFTVGWSIPSRD